MDSRIRLHTDSVQLSYSINHNKNDAYALHCHNLYEVYYFISGDVSYLVEGKKYTPAPHSILMMRPNIFHGVKIETDAPYERYTLHFNPAALSLENRALLLSPFSLCSNQTDIYYEHADSYSIDVYFENLLACRSMSSDIQEMAMNIRMEALLSQLLFMSRSTKENSYNHQVHQTVAAVIAYVNEHLTESLTLDQLSSAFFISKHHLNKIFRKAVGTTIGDYIIYKRVILAQQEMIQGKSAQAAAAASGFHDYSSFYRAYKRIFGHSPTGVKAP